MDHKPWFRTWQDHLFSDPRFHQLTLEAKGLLWILWGMTNRESGKKCRLDVPSLSRWCNHYCNDARTPAGMTACSAEVDPCFSDVLQELIDLEWITIHDDGKYYTSNNWDKWQDKAYEAWKKREQRKRRPENVPYLSSKCPPIEEEGEGERSSPSVVSSSSSPTPPKKPRAKKEKPKRVYSDEEIKAAFDKASVKYRDWKSRLPVDEQDFPMGEGMK